MGKKKLPSYQELVKSYPFGETADEVRHRIGGNVDHDWYENTCVIRVSESLNEAKHPIPADSGNFKTRRGANKKWYGLGVQQFWEYLERTYGKPDIYAERDPATGRIPYFDFFGNTGIIGFRVKGWNDASGHFTLFNGLFLMYGGADHDYWSISSKAALWKSG